MNLVKYVNNLNQAQRRAAEPLGAVAADYIAGLNRHKHQARIVDVWSKILPERVAAHCRLERIKNGVIWVVAEPGSWMWELTTMKQSLLELLRLHAPLAKIKTIIFTPRAA